MKKYVVALLAYCIAVTACASDDVGGYLFVTFRGAATPMTEQVYFMVSENGQRWEALNNKEPVLVSTVGEKGVRDPYIIRSADGDGFYLIATDLSIHHNPDWTRAQTAASQSIVVWESKDLVNWSAPRLVKVAPDDAGCTWAPEAIYDSENDRYMVFWASKTGRDNYSKHRIWAAHTQDFKSFSEPFVYIEKPHTVIDTTIVNEEGTFYRFSKDEAEKTITMERSEHLMGEWDLMEDFSLASLTGYEGPASFVLKSHEDGEPSHWSLLLDFYSKGEGYQAYETDNLSSGDFKAVEAMKFPFHPVRHGTVLSLSTAEFQRLNAADKTGSITVSD
ncbi:glycoside hydrolase family 43 protein [Gilvimarinus sp. SDUM040013]|uniref:Glycoside hydrolase family 43 protein n=1 Tax=Gilvimarinus gilvus TaxID=3058038 RepID=A0ABU4RZD8_9GAMM|nr:glycoside hydrolase family 43 protein [Gilvimarinus sp. SDUM040013]MDO3387274.1 glycoside hydrolase family 43 protein [Gilvimarinus sp. SDUM040013]MDX6848963.1 glycoside hydrolase family 43 protein [Gilvimarinus sp. SDUM040013]